MVASLSNNLASAEESSGFRSTLLAVESCLPFGFEESGDYTITEDAETSTVTYEEYYLAFERCSDDSVSCIDDCAEADISFFSILIDGTSTVTLASESFSIGFASVTMDIVNEDESASVALDGDVEGTIIGTEYTATWTDFSVSTDDGTDSISMTVNGELTYDSDTELVNGVIVLTVNGDEATCVFIDYSETSSTPPACTI